MTSVQSQVSRSPVIGSINLEESQYQTWSYLVEIARVTQWLPVLNGTTNNSLSLQFLIALTKYATTSCHRLLFWRLVLIDICGSRYVGDYFLVL
jgi:hypothetical protein